MASLAIPALLIFGTSTYAASLGFGFETTSSQMPCVFNHTVHHTSSHGQLHSLSESPTTFQASSSSIYMFDLCPLLNRVTSQHPIRLKMSEDTPPTRTERIYEMVLDPAGRGLRRDGTLTGELQCPENTWICLTVTNSRPSHPSEPTRVLQVVPVAGYLDLDPAHSGLDVTSKLEFKTGKKLESKFDRSEDPARPYGLTVNLHGGYYTGLRQKATFKYICDETLSEDDDTSQPQLSWVFNGTHAFEWKTRHACATILPLPGDGGNSGGEKPPENSDEDKTGDTEQPPPDDEEGGNKDEEEGHGVLDPTEPGGNHMFRSRPGQIVLTMIPVLLFLYFLFPPLLRRLGFRLTSVAKLHVATHSILAKTRSLYKTLLSRNPGYTSIHTDYTDLDSEMAMFDSTSSTDKRYVWPTNETPAHAISVPRKKRKMLVFPSSLSPSSTARGGDADGGDGGAEDVLWSADIPLTPSPGHSMKAHRSYGGGGSQYGTIG